MTPLPQPPNDLLIEAVGRGSLEGARAALNAGADPNAFGDSGASALVLAVRNDIEPIIRLLLEAGADPNADNGPGRRLPPTLFMAALWKFTPTARLLIAFGADPNAATSDGKTPLMAAAVGTGGAEVAAALLEAGADWTRRDPGQRTAEMLAADDPAVRAVIRAWRERRELHEALPDPPQSGAVRKM